MLALMLLITIDTCAADGRGNFVLFKINNSLIASSAGVFNCEKHSHFFFNVRQFIIITHIGLAQIGNVFL